MKSYLLFVLLLSVPMPVLSYYKCTNELDEVVYQKIPCRPTSTEKKIHVYTPPQSGVVKGSEFDGDESISNEKSTIIRSKLSSAIASLSPIKKSVTEYYRSKGEWPRKLSDIKMNKDEMTSSYIDEIILGDNGEVAAHLNSDFGNDKQIIIKPKSVMGDTSFEWKCYANFTKQLLSSSDYPLCKSRVINKRY